MYTVRILLVLSILLVPVCALTQTPEPKAIWHFDGNRDSGNGDEDDWAFAVFPTDRQEYMCAGYTGKSVAGPGLGISSQPVIFKLDRFGKLIWSKVVNNVSGGGYTSTGLIRFGYFNQIIKIPGGYAAAGFIQENGINAYRMLITEFDDDGNYLNATSTMLNHVGSSSASSRIQSIVIDPTTNYYFVAGAVGSDAFVAKINRSTWNVTNSYINGANGGNDSRFNKVAIKTTVSGYDVVACGYKSNPSTTNIDGQAIVGLNRDSDTVTLYKRNKDIWVVSLTSSLSSTENFSVTFDKTNLGSITFTDEGPVTARFANIFGHTSYLSPLVRNNLYAAINYDERGDDLIITQDGDIAITALVNRIVLWGYGGDNGKEAFQTGPNSVSDPVRPYDYDFYADGDGYLMKISSSNGSLIWNRNIGHFSSPDFFVKLVQQECGDILISGSSADYYHGIDEYESQLICTEDNGSPSSAIKWKRYFHADNETNVCVFSIANTNDGGFVTAGNNNNQFDNFSITKFSAPAINEMTYDVDDNVHVIGTDLPTSWPGTGVPNGAKIAGKIVVPAGVTLSISNITVNFAPSEHLHDYMEFHSSIASGIECGIFVEAGGRLEVDNSTLQGVTGCNGQRFMWDGIVIEGDPTLNQNTSNQGSAEITNSTIRDARVGVAQCETMRLYENKQNAVIDDVTCKQWHSAYGSTSNKGGGILLMDSTEVQNCRFGVRIHSYPTPGFGLAANNPCTIRNSHFFADAPMADIYFYSDQYGRRLPQNAHFTAVEIDDVDLRDNIFECDPLVFDEDIRGYGITTWDAGVTVDRSCSWYGPSGCVSGAGPGNAFRYLRFGVSAGFSTAYASYPLNIWFSSFEHNRKGALVSGSQNSLNITDNTFYVPAYGTVEETGVELVACDGYDVSYNTFDAGTTFSGLGNTGIFIKNGHDNNNIVYRNFFSNLQAGCISLQRNGSADAGLQWRCNDYITPDEMIAIARLSHDASNSTTVGGTLREHQGDCVPSPSDPDYYSAPAGNRFYNACTGAENRLYADADAVSAQTVFYNFNEATTVFDPDVCYTNFGYSPNNCATGSSGGDDDIIEACPDHHIVVGEGLMRVSTINEEMNSISSQSNSGLVNALASEQYFAVSDVAREYSRQRKYDSAAYFLMQNGRYAHAIPFFMQAGLFTEARDAWNQMPKSTVEEQQYALLLDSTINIYGRGQSWRNLNSTGRAMILQLADSSNNFVGYLAMGAAEIAGIKSFNYPSAAIPQLSGNKSATGSAKSNSGSPHLLSEKRIRKLALYPNPTDGELTISSPAPGTVTVYNLQGKKVYATTINTGETRFKLPTSLSSGLYSVAFTTNNGKTETARFVYQP